MHNQSYKFSLLLIWCCLLSISIVIMVAVIAKGSIQGKETPRTGQNDTAGEARAAGYSADPGQSSVNYIHLVWGNDTSPWTHSPSCFCENTSLLLQNYSVLIKTGGFYHTYAQVTFIDPKETEGTVTLVANEKVPGKAARKLSEAEHRYGTVSMSGVIRLRSGDIVKLNISPVSLLWSRDASKTYWGLFLLAKREDK